MSLDRNCAVCVTTRAASTCPGSLRPSALTMASRDSTVLGITPSRMASLKGLTEHWRKGSYPCCTNLGCLRHSGEKLWDYLSMYTTEAFTSSVLDSTPYEALYGSKPDISMLRVWGCTAYVLVQKDKRPLGSFGSHMEKCIFIGYPPGYKAWKFYCPESKKVVIS